MVLLSKFWSLSEDMGVIGWLPSAGDDGSVVIGFPTVLPLRRLPVSVHSFCLAKRAWSAHTGTGHNRRLSAYFTLLRPVWFSFFVVFRYDLALSLRIARRISTLFAHFLTLGSLSGCDVGNPSNERALPFGSFGSLWANWIFDVKCNVLDSVLCSFLPF